LINRGVQMLVDNLQIDTQEAQALLETYGSVRNALNNYKK